MPETALALEMRGVEKQYGALRPLRVRSLHIHLRSRTALIGLDQPAAEAFVNLLTGAALPERGEVTTLGQPTAEIADGEAWLAFVERFGFVSPRIVMLESMTIAQNLAIPFGLELDPIPPDVLPRVEELAIEVQIGKENLGTPVSATAGLLRAKVWLARALALKPDMLVLEHPTADVPGSDVRSYGRVLSDASERRGLTTVALTMDETLARTLGGKRLIWEPASGEFRERRAAWF